ncbi:MAG: hypothetical protein LBF78_15185, partial [Treponema sp.]|nr:hypothetical protein [Treponema sp.]
MILLLFGVSSLSAQEGGDSPEGNAAEQQAEGAETGLQTASDAAPDAEPESEAQNAAQDSAYQNAAPESEAAEDAIGEAAGDLPGPAPPELSAEEAIPDPDLTQIKAPDEKQLNILRYGTETEIAALIKNLKTEKDSSLDQELVKLAETSKNKVILSGIFSFFGEMEKSGLEDRAIRIIEERDDEANETVSAAVDYLGKVKAASSIKALEELINSGERAFLNLAIRSLGRTAKGGDGSGADEAAKFLLSYYEEGNPSNE